MQKSTLETLDQRHQRLRRQGRAQVWTLIFSFGLGAGAATRELTLLAPRSAAEEVLGRAHNGILLLHPAALRIRTPTGAPGLERWTERLRQLHAIPIAVNDEPSRRGSGAPLDLPSLHLPLITPTDPGLLALGLDIGGTGMKVCAAQGGRILRCSQGETWPEGERGLDSLLRRARALLREVSGGEQAGSLGIGFASPMGLDGKVTGLSTVMRQRLGGPQVLQDFAQQVSRGFTDGPVALFNDLANLGRFLSGMGKRRLLRLQIGTSFGGCWIDADGTVNGAELGRLIVHASEDARPHTYLPLRGAMKSYLSNYGVALSLEQRCGRPVTPQEAGYLLAELVEANDPRGLEVVEWLVELLEGVVAESRVFLPGLQAAELGGSMLQGATGRVLSARLRSIPGPVALQLSRDPGYDGALAAAQAPLLNTPLRGMKRLGA